MAKPRTEPSRDPFPTDEEITERAYELCFLERDADQPASYIELAEEELLNRAAKRALLPARPRRR